MAGGWERSASIWTMNSGPSAADGRGELLDRRRAERRPEPAELEDQPRELVPGAAALAGRVVEPRWSLEREDADLGREVRREGGGQDLVVDDAHLVPLARGLEHGVDEIAALRAARPEAVEARGAHHLMVAAVVQDRVLAGQLGDGVDIQRVRAVGLHVGGALRPVEDVVRADVHQPRAEVPARARQVPRGGPVQRERPLGLRLAAWQVVEGGRVDHYVGPQPPEHLPHRLRVADLEVLVREPPDVLPRKRLDEVAAELSRAAEDDDAAQNTPPIRLSVASISARSPIH